MPQIENTNTSQENQELIPTREQLKRRRHTEACRKWREANPEKYAEHKRTYINRRRLEKLRKRGEGCANG